jgi:hypothetical protein
MLAPESKTISQPSKHRGLADIDAGIHRPFLIERENHQAKIEKFKIHEMKQLY